MSDSELNACIGILVGIRYELGMSSIDLVCAVERDMAYLFRKNINIQFFSMVASMIAINQAIYNKLLAALALICFLPFNIYNFLGN